MATSATLLSVTPYSAVYELGGDGTGNAGLIDYTNAATFNALAAGPLKAEIKYRLAQGTLAALNLNLDSARVRIYFVTGVNLQPLFTPASTTILWTASGISILLPGGGESPGGQVLIEVRFEHSEKR